MRIGRGLRGALDDGASDEVKNAAFERFQGALQQDRRRQLITRQGLAAGLVAALLLVGGAALWPDPTLTFTASAEAPGGYLRVDRHQPAAIVDFSDGTRLQLHPESQARIAEVTAKGARLALEGGSVHLKVSPRPGASWSVEAGPYRILVTGTEFDVKWRASDDRLEVELQEGSVRVEGPLTSNGIRVSAGERLTADLRTSELRLRSRANPGAASGQVALGALVASAAPPVDQAPARAESAGPPAETVAEAATRFTGPDDKNEVKRSVASSPGEWARLMGKSQYRAIVSDAQEGGLEVVLSSVTANDLGILADAARYSGQAGVAKQALLAVRNRFPGQKQALSAAFILGRLAEDQLRDMSGALTWYTVYMQESPSGAFASEALGRKMGVVHETRGRVAAESLAESYLQRYPTGPYATSAQRILSQ
ncbi:MAG: hypothetical protein RJA70_2724 [Pseudomonadota bacterium]|jgi:TolA-binding protein